MFLTGDKFEVRNRGHQGTIVKIGEDDVVVKWDSFKGEHSYSKNEALALWEPLKDNCSHVIKEYIGITTSCYYCETCNKESQYL